MDLRTLFKTLSAELIERGIEPSLRGNPPCGTESIREFERASSLQLPRRISDIYTGFADGFIFEWEDSQETSGLFGLPPLSQLTEDTQTWQDTIRSFTDDPSSMDQCVAPPYREEAFRCWNRMRSWIPIWNEGNGDHFCLDATTGEIQYYPHAWYDGFGKIATTCGIPAGTDLDDFVVNWSRYYFTPPHHYYWGAFLKAGRITWEPSYFGTDHVRPGLH
ncbi:hypothetical protein [Luteolibacter sp. LG18]|uniref:hypothetical protein n=1 Tax=Luteolibacter sp. LG18 TaxID=2819286 RepID=UPI002B2B56B1|nr:hypothetical protein llg_00400 [Luteolibacter sp. LG18]